MKEMQERNRVGNRQMRGERAWEVKFMKLCI